MRIFNRAGARSAHEGYLWEMALVWAAIWLATGVVLKGGGDFADMIPILAVGMVFNGASSLSTPKELVWGAVVVWAAIWLATGVVLKGGGAFADMIPILAIGTAWFLAVTPALSARARGHSADA